MPSEPQFPSAVPTGLAWLARAARAETAEVWRLDAVPSAATLKGREYQLRRRRIQWLRRGVQGLFLLLVIWIGVDFTRFVRGLEAGRIAVERPAGVEGFLPISGLLSLRYLLATGTISPVHPAALVLLLLFIGVSLLVKKAFCSWICPVGSLSEALAALSQRLFRRKIALPRWLDLPLRGLKYLLLAFFVWTIFVRMTLPLVDEFLGSPYNRVADIKMFYFFARISPFAATTLLVLLALSLVVPYAWCRYLCPYGALFGLVSLFAPAKITRQAASCIDCGLCARACPSHLPVDRLQRVRSDECVGCMSCVADCPVPRALQLELPGRSSRHLRPALVAAAIVALFLGGVLAARASRHWQTNVPQSEVLERIHDDLSSAQYQHLR